MDIFGVLTMIGGLALFLYGMEVLGDGLKKASGGKLEIILEKLTSNKLMAVLLGAGVTAIIQSSSATTVMVVGFVSSGIMSLSRAVGVILGANVGTTITAWILSLAEISGAGLLFELLKPTSFSPIFAMIGVAIRMASKNEKKQNAATIMIGFAVLMFGMDMMSGAVKPLANVPEFRALLLKFSNPILGMLVGLVFTAVIQSSSASIGVLQALCMSGAVSYATAIPIIMGQNIGTCVTALLSSVGANKNAKRAAFVHLSFNVIGTVVWLTTFCIVDAVFSPALLNEAASLAGIAVAHSAFNILCTMLLLPMTGLLEKLALTVIKDDEAKEKFVELDERLLATPTIALQQCKATVFEMGMLAAEGIYLAFEALDSYNSEKIVKVKELEDKTDKYEDIIGEYLVKLSGHKMSEADALESTKLHKMIGDLERLSDHSVNITESVKELNEKNISLSDQAEKELNLLVSAVKEIISITKTAFENDDVESAMCVEPLEQVIDDLKEKLRTSHIKRLNKGECSIEAGFVWSDLLHDLERISDHCSNIAGCIIEASHNDITLHAGLRGIRNDSTEYFDKYKEYFNKYQIRS